MWRVEVMCGGVGKDWRGVGVYGCWRVCRVLEGV